MIDTQPKQKPHESKQTGKDKSRSPAEIERDHRDHNCRNHPSYAGAAIKNGNSQAALLAGEPLCDSLACSGPVEPFADSEQESKRGESKNRSGETGKDVDERPKHYGES